MTAQGHYIAGRWLTSGEHPFEALDPATGHTYWTGASAGAEEIEAAVAAARDSFPAWDDLGLESRTALIRGYADLLGREKQALADTISLETGKPKWEALTEVAAMIGKIEISIRSHEERTGFRRAGNGPVQAVLRHRPHGVLGVLGPYNFPGHLPNGHIVPALLAGNTVVLKPSELTPLTAQRCVGLWQQAGLPAGVLNLVQGEAQTGRLLSTHPGLAGILFTGSARTGQALHRQTAGMTGRILALEMGGNNPLIVAEPAEPLAATYHALISAFISAGQRCTCARRLYLPAGQTGDAVLQRLLEAAATLRVGGPQQDTEAFMGPVISAAAAERMLQAQEALRRAGAQVLLSMRHLDPATGLLSPGIIDVSPVAELSDEEYFGPLLQVCRYDSFDEALRAANRTRFGLAAGLLGGTDAHYERFLQEIRAGIVNRNRPLTGASSALPFGGIGDSGNHRPSAYYAADYCSYPVASQEAAALDLPEKLEPGIVL